MGRHSTRTLDKRQDVNEPRQWRPLFPIVSREPLVALRDGLRVSETRPKMGLDLKPPGEAQTGALDPELTLDCPVEVPVLPCGFPLQLRFRPRLVFEAHDRHRRKIDGRLAIDNPICKSLSGRRRD